MSSPKDGVLGSRYSEPSGARSFLVLLSANTANSVLLKQRRIPFTVLEISEGQLPFLKPPMIAAARRVLGRTVISITEKKVLSGKPWISRYGKADAGGALTSLVEEVFTALPESESALAFSNPGGEWRLVGYRLGSLASRPESALGLDRLLR
ncbi:MAG: hypothetical protein WHS82_02665 [Candidatus Methanosuratincola sp.]